MALKMEYIIAVVMKLFLGRKATMLSHCRKVAKMLITSSDMKSILLSFCALRIENPHV
jgi:hypothetical protein